MLNGHGMRWVAVVLAGVGAALGLAAPAGAEFGLTAQRSVLAGDSSKDLVALYARNDGTGLQAGSHNLMALRATFSSASRMYFASTGSGSSQSADITGATLWDADHWRWTSTSYSRIAIFDYYATQHHTSPADVLGADGSAPPPRPWSNYAGGVTSLSIDLAALNDYTGPILELGPYGIKADSTVGGGKGIPFAWMVVPRTASLSVSGDFMSDNGYFASESITSPPSVVPEPGSVGVIGAGMLILLWRRRG